MDGKTKGLLVVGGAAAALGTAYLLTREAEALEPADIFLSNLTIEPETVKTGEIAVAMVEATNLGGVKGSYLVLLSVDTLPDPITKQKTVVLNPTETQEVKFNITAPEPGVYTVYVGDEQASLIVIESDGAPPIVPPIEPPNIILSDLVIEPSSVMPNDLVLISVVATNNGGATGTKTVVLVVNDEVVSEADVSLNPNQSKAVEFQVIPQDSGVYNVSVDGLSGILEVGGAQVYIPGSLTQEFIYGNAWGQNPYDGSTITIRGNKDWEGGEILGSRTGDFDYRRYGTSWCEFEVVVRNTLDVGQVFNMTVSNRTIPNNYISPNGTLHFGPFYCWCRGASETWHWDWSYAVTSVGFSGEMSPLSKFSGSYELKTLTWTPTWQQFQAVVPKITNLTDEWQCIAITNYGAIQAVPPNGTINLKFPYGTLGQYNTWTIYDVVINGRLWLEVEQISGSVVNVTEYDIWH